MNTESVISQNTQCSREDWGSIKIKHSWRPSTLMGLTYINTLSLTSCFMSLCFIFLKLGRSLKTACCQFDKNGKLLVISIVSSCHIPSASPLLNKYLSMALKNHMLIIVTSRNDSSSELRMTIHRLSMVPVRSLEHPKKINLSTGFPQTSKDEAISLLKKNTRI